MRGGGASARPRQRPPATWSVPDPPAIGADEDPLRRPAGENPAAVRAPHEPGVRAVGLDQRRAVAEEAEAGAAGAALEQRGGAAAARGERGGDDRVEGARRADVARREVEDPGPCAARDEEAAAVGRPGERAG